MTILAHEEQALFRAVVPGGMTAYGASLTGKVGVHFYGHTPLQKGFIGNHIVQCCKRPLAVLGVGAALLDAGFLAFFASGTLSDVGQVLKANERVRISLYYLLTHAMIGVLLQPSLSPTYRYQSPFR